MPPPLVIPLYREAGDGAQQVGFAAVARQMLDRLVDEEAGLLARPLFAEQRDEGRLAGMGVLAGAACPPPLRRRYGR